MIGLINKLKEHEDIEHVFFDEDGGWSVIPSDKHPIKVPRANVLAKEKEALAAAQFEDDELTKDEEIQNLNSENKLLKDQVELLESENSALEEQIHMLSQPDPQIPALQNALEAAHKELEELKAKK